MKKSDATAKSAHNPVSTVIVLLSSLRRPRLGMSASSFTTGHAPYQQTRQHIDNERYEKQNQTELDERLQVYFRTGFRKLVGNCRGDRKRRIKERSGYLRPIA